MTEIEINDYLRQWRYSPSFINWKDDTIPPTRIWYQPESNSFTSDCGVTIPFNYDVHCDMYKCISDMILEIIKYYEEKGIKLEV